MIARFHIDDIARGVGRVLLCYLLAFQAVVAAASLVQAAGASSPFAEICHNAGDDASHPQNDRKTSHAACALCTAAATAAALADPPAVNVDRSVFAAYRDTPRSGQTIRLSPPRAGHSRAPPAVV